MKAICRPWVVGLSVLLSLVAARAGATVVSISLPQTRQVTQRNNSNTADLFLQGTLFGGPVARLEARAMVMSGGTNNGVATDWMVIAAVPADGNYSGVLSN